jgi:hypothetical protein
MLACKHIFFALQIFIYEFWLSLKFGKTRLWKSAYVHKRGQSHGVWLPALSLSEGFVQLAVVLAPGGKLKTPAAGRNP